MLLVNFFRYFRALLPVLPLVFSFYLIILDSNSFWLKIVGPGQIILSIFWCISSIFCLKISFTKLIKRTRRSRNIFYVVYCITLVFGVIFLFVTSSTRRLEFISKMNSFLNNAASSELATIFTHVYPVVHMQQDFIYRRTLEAHDIALAILIIWVAMTFVLEYFSDTIISFLGEDILPNSIQENNEFDNDQHEESSHEDKNAGGDVIMPVIPPVNEQEPKQPSYSESESESTKKEEKEKQEVTEEKEEKKEEIKTKIEEKPLTPEKPEPKKEEEKPVIVKEDESEKEEIKVVKKTSPAKTNPPAKKPQQIKKFNADIDFTDNSDDDNIINKWAETSSSGIKKKKQNNNDLQFTDSSSKKGDDEIDFADSESAQKQKPKKNDELQFTDEESSKKDGLSSGIVFTDDDSPKKAKKKQNTDIQFADDDETNSKPKNSNDILFTDSGDNKGNSSIQFADSDSPKKSDDFGIEFTDSNSPPPPKKKSTKKNNDSFLAPKPRARKTKQVAIQDNLDDDSLNDLLEGL